MINNLNCLEVLSQELGLINASRTLVGSIPITTHSKVTNSKLALYFMKKLLANSDGLSDLITVVTIVHTSVNKTLILTVLKKITDKYIEFKREQAEQDQAENTKSTLGEFKLYMNRIIKFEESNYDLNTHEYNYNVTPPSEMDVLLGGEVIHPNQLLLANEEVEEVRQIMLSNINKLLSRGDKINMLVDQTDRLNVSSLVFQKRAQQIKRRMWFSGMKFYLLLGFGGLILVYFILGLLCGFPYLERCM